MVCSLRGTLAQVVALEFSAPVVGANAPKPGGDPSWVDCLILVEVGTFAARVHASFLLDELRDLLCRARDVAAMNATTASFEAMEEALRLNFMADKLGHVRVGGKVKEIASSRVSLEFEFEAEMAALMSFARQLEVIVGDSGNDET
jgi:hypothetical protein